MYWFYFVSYNLRFNRNFIDDLLIYFKVSVSKYDTQLLSYCLVFAKKYDFTFLFGMSDNYKISRLLCWIYRFLNVMIQYRCNFHFNNKRDKMVGFFKLIKKGIFFASFSFFNSLHKHFMLKPWI